MFEAFVDEQAPALMSEFEPFWDYKVGLSLFPESFSIRPKRMGSALQCAAEDDGPAHMKAKREKLLQRIQDVPDFAKYPAAKLYLKPLTEFKEKDTRELRTK